MNDTVRILPLAGASNFRDLGGYPTVDGRYTRWGRLFRSDTLDELTETDIALLRTVGLRTIIDLRTQTEIDLNGRGLLGRETAAYHHLSVIDEDGGESRGIPSPMDGKLANRSLWYLEIGRDALVAALNIIGEGANHPLVFHCAAGKDRTGALAAVILEILGVERDAIIEDYLLTASRMELILARLLPVMERRLNYELPPNALVVEAATMEGFLDGLDQRHGGARQWALDAGVAAATLDAMAASLLTSEDA